MELMEVLKQRRSVRKFQNKDIDESILDDILLAGKLAPETDSCNYYFGVIKDTEIKKEIGKATHWADWVAKAPVIIACCCDISWDIADQDDKSYGVTGNIKRYSKEVVDFLRTHENRKACKKLTLATPTYIAAQQMILAAVSHGLKGCLVDFIDIEKINNILGLPDNITCQLLMPIGYSDETPKQKQPWDDSKRIFTNKWK